VQDAPGEIQFAMRSLRPKLAPRKMFTTEFGIVLGWKPTQMFVNGMQWSSPDGSPESIGSSPAYSYG
jgi:hypothetical protein